MQLPLQLVQRLAEAYQRDFGRALSDSDAEALGCALIGFYWEAFGDLDTSAFDEILNKRDAAQTPPNTL